jgi:3-isopropylmalate/(R)-2-methylmalate dehydratase small subunit
VRGAGRDAEFVIRTIFKAVLYKGSEAGNEQRIMKPFTKHTGLVAAMDRANVDTDQIIPKQFLKRIERTGFGQFLFFDWRFRDDGSLNPEFELNRSEFAGATILLTRRNFGCGSSREHAPWALEDYGFRAIIAPSFADIFYNNCFKNGLLPVRLDDAAVEDLFGRVADHRGYRLTVDLERCTINDQYGLTLSFDVDPFRRHSLLGGLDDIGLTLQYSEKIADYETAHGIGTTRRT